MSDLETNKKKLEYLQESFPRSQRPRWECI